MSRLVGLKALSPVAVKITPGDNPAAAAQGYGACAFDSDNPTTTKHVGAAQAIEASAQHVIAGARIGDSGEANEKNAPPYRCFKWAYGHAGDVSGFEAIKAGLVGKLNPMVRMVPLGETGADHTFRLLLSALFGSDMSDAKDMDVKLLRPAIADAAATLEELQKGAGATPGGFTAVLSNGDLLAGVRFGEPLWVLEREAGAHGASKASAITGLTVDVAAGPKTIVLASEPLTDEAGWREIADRSVVTVSHELVVTETAFADAHNDD